MAPILVRDAYTQEELDKIQEEKQMAVYKAQIERDKTELVKVLKTVAPDGSAIYTIEYGDGTAYKIDEYTATWITDMTKSLLKTRM